MNSNNLLNAQEYVTGLQGINTVTLSGQQFINESTQRIAFHPFNHTEVVGLVSRAVNSPDMQVQKWGQEQANRIDESFMTFNIGFLCESVKYSTSGIFNNFKSVAGDLLKMGEADIVRAIAVDGAFQKYSMIPEVALLIQKAKNLTLAASGVNAQLLTSEDKFSLLPVLAIYNQVAADTYIVGFNGDAKLIYTKSTDKLTLGNYTDIMAAIDGENFGFDFDNMSFATQALAVLEKTYDADMQSFVFTILGNKIHWRLTDGHLMLNGSDKSFEDIIRITQAKLTALSTKQTPINQQMHSIADDVLLEAFNVLYANKDSLMLFDAVVAIPNGDAMVFVACSNNPDVNVPRPYTYTCFTRYNNGQTMFMNSYDSFEAFVKQFVNAYTATSVRKLYEKEIAVENNISAVAHSSNMASADNITKLQAERDKLEAAKLNLPASSLNDINRQIMTIDDLILKTQGRVISR